MNEIINQGIQSTLKDSVMYSLYTPLRAKVYQVYFGGLTQLSGIALHHPHPSLNPIHSEACVYTHTHTHTQSHRDTHTHTHTITPSHTHTHTQGYHKLFATAAGQISQVTCLLVGVQVKMLSQSVNFSALSESSESEEITMTLDSPPAAIMRMRE